jgi:ATP-dependent DNA helicase PIF1
LAEKTIPKTLDLKVGAQVMLLRNRNIAEKDDDFTKDKKKALGLVNGSRGVIIKFIKSAMEDGNVPVVKFDDGQVLTIGRVDYALKRPNSDGVLFRRQVPLRLAW